jgi:hypothetical protein
VGVGQTPTFLQPHRLGPPPGRDPISTIRHVRALVPTRPTATSLLHHSDMIGLSTLASVSRVASESLHGHVSPDQQVTHRPLPELG